MSGGCNIKRVRECRYLRQARSLLGFEFVRFLVVGGLNLSFSYAVYALLLYVGLPYPVANFLAMVAGILFSFKTQGRLVFDNADNRLIWRYAIFWGGLYAMNIGVITLMLGFGVSAYAAGAFAIPVIALCSYFMQKHLIFKK